MGELSFYTGSRMSMDWKSDLTGVELRRINYKGYNCQLVEQPLLSCPAEYVWPCFFGSLSEMVYGYRCWEIGNLPPLIHLLQVIVHNELVQCSQRITFRLEKHLPSTHIVLRIMPVLGYHHVKRYWDMSLRCLSLHNTFQYRQVTHSREMWNSL
jgi:hypothetical protein